MEPWEQSNNNSNPVLNLSAQNVDLNNLPHITDEFSSLRANINPDELTPKAQALNHSEIIKALVYMKNKEK